MTDSKLTCAVWYSMHFCPYVEICEDELEAVRFAEGMLEAGTGYPVGVQYADGRCLAKEEWEQSLVYLTYQAEQDRWTAERLDAMRKAARKSRPEPILISSPFEADVVSWYEASEGCKPPKWLGKG